MIRQFQAEDAESCCSMIRTSLAEDSSLSPGLREKFQAAETPAAMEERSKLFYVVVYESEGKILGVAGLDMNEIRLLCVSPESRRMGIGRALIGHLNAMVPGALFPDVFVYSSVEGRKFYSACGFLEKGMVRFDFGGEQILTYFMSLSIR